MHKLNHMTDRFDEKKSPTLDTKKGMHESYCPDSAQRMVTVLRTHLFQGPFVHHDGAHSVATIVLCAPL